MPTWRMPDLGRVTASITSQAVTVSDDAAFAKWVAERYPTEVETVARVRGAWAAEFLSDVTVDEDTVVDSSTGEIVPGVAVRRGGAFKGIAIYADDSTKQAMAAIAEAELQDYLNVVDQPAVLAELSDAPVA